MTEYARLATPPHGYVALRTTTNSIEIRERRQCRFLWLWKRWRTYVLASTVYAVSAGDDLELTAVGGALTAKVNGKPVLWWVKPA